MRLEIRESLLSLSLCIADGGAQFFPGKGSEGGFLLVLGEGLGVEVSHLLFTDDTLVFCEASQSQMLHLRWLYVV